MPDNSALADMIADLRRQKDLHSDRIVEAVAAGDWPACDAAAERYQCVDRELFKLRIHYQRTRNEHAGR